jgi:hypothetical protein
MKINALIIASEITKGMKSIGSRSLLSISDSTKVIDQQIQSLKTIHKNIQITIACGYEYDKVSQHVKKYKNVDTIYNPHYKTTNEAENISLYLKTYNNLDNLLIVNGGVLLKKYCDSYSKLKNNTPLIFLLNGPKNNFTLGCSNTEKIEYIFYDLEHAWSECVYLSSNEITLLRSYFVINLNISQKYLFEIINNILGMSPIEKVFLNKKDIMKITNVQDVQKAKNFI